MSYRSYLYEHILKQAVKLLGADHQLLRSLRKLRNRVRKFKVIKKERFLAYIESPNASGCRVSSPFIVSGWLIQTTPHKLVGLKVLLNEEARAYTGVNLKRQDVADAFPNYPSALWSGFAVEVFADDFLRDTATVTLVVCFEDFEEEVAQFEVAVESAIALVERREVSWKLSEILACPSCGSSLIETKGNFKCAQCGVLFETRRGVPVFAKAGDIAHSRLLQTLSTNPLADFHIAMVEKEAQGIVLNLGAGNPRKSEHRPNLLFHEMLHYPHTDVVSTYEKLPYKDETFDAVISLAVFEHLRRPWEMADEVYRVLKPGGRVYVDTAFMQPLHADPSHWFNMTLGGVREIFKKFKHLKSGVQPYQMPSFGLRMQIDVILDHVHSDHWRKVFEELRSSLNDDFDKALDEKGREYLAAGVFFEGTK